jgi:Fic family protein
MNDGEERHSQALEVELIVDQDEKARVEASNGLEQFDAVAGIIETHLDPERPFKLRPSTILTVHRYALKGISAFAGVWRPTGIEIKGSKHEPPEAFLVPELVEGLCDYVNEHWKNTSAFHLCAYVLWRLNWIHPFVDGNGRTARAISYLVLCIRLGYRLPGSNTIPEQIAEDKNPYYRALESADEFQAKGEINLSMMEKLLEGYLAKQLVGVLEKAGASIPETTKE